MLRSRFEFNFSQQRIVDMAKHFLHHSMGIERIPDEFCTDFEPPTTNCVYTALAFVKEFDDKSVSVLALDPNDYPKSNDSLIHSDLSATSDIDEKAVEPKVCISLQKKIQ